MRSSTVLLALATAVYAQIPGLPSCAQSCITSFGDCNPIDVGCICKAGGLIANLSCCVSKQCDATDQTAVIKFADSICAPYNSNLPTAATCASTAAATGSASSASSSSTGGSTMSTTSMTTEATAASSTESSAASSTSTNASASTTSGTAASSAASSAAASQSSTISTGGANSLQGMGLGMVLAGVVAAL
ncbi:Hypothetical protein R9X50_00660500 [Acrodontium crateriforme]|uniref:CFEM domain-containing protein n=1 Tax=Acrodontium crateriforme TaxID=150365 RepID=A0AAQ3MDD9_9PEZI|nr:Hypothetical protein R9X50_00660500 [Acrodontium crateriforme]